MELIGQCVKHIAWGTGIIQHMGENTIVVEFPDRIDGPSDVKFQFPDSFEKGFLSTEDHNLREYIATLADERTCSICGANGVQTKLIDGKRHCRRCEEQYTVYCPVCKKNHIKDKITFIDKYGGFLDRILLCSDCASEKSFTCDSCKGRFLMQYQASKYRDRTLCKRCYTAAMSECRYCGEVFDREFGKFAYMESGFTYVCSKCAEQHTFVCSSCNNRKVNEVMAESKYLRKGKNLCQKCVAYCQSCGEALEKENAVNVYSETYCGDCWNKKSRECTICGERFVEKEESECCPDCVEMKAYIERLRKIDWLSAKAKFVDYSMLENVDRCQLFTNMFVHCMGKYHPEQRWYYNELSEPVHLLVLKLYGWRIVTTYLPQSVFGKVKPSEILTLTHFRSRKGRVEVSKAIDMWLDKSIERLHTGVGEVILLDYPVRLRTQTAFDKIYGKQWNGPDDYIEIGNYGDTTNFYMIGIVAE